MLTQEVYGWGWLSVGRSGHAEGPVSLDLLLQLGVAQICCAEKCFLILSRTGRVYMCSYSGEEQVHCGANLYYCTVHVCTVCTSITIRHPLVYTTRELRENHSL